MLKLFLRNIFGKLLIIQGVLFLTATLASADIKLPKVIGNHMVLQRDVPIRIWGWANAGEKVTATLAGKTAETTTKQNGKWSIELDPLPAGGPYQLQLQGNNLIEMDDILIGDVWVCSGQSNMEWPLNNTEKANEEMVKAKFQQIRLFTVPKVTSASPLEDLESGEWQECSPETVQAFSAVGYYFGKHIHQTQNVPVGLINSSWGGTVAETWMSANAIKEFNEFQPALKEVTSTDYKKLVAEQKVKLQQWMDDLKKKDEGMKDGQPIWSDPSFKTKDWKQMELPILWEQAALKDLDGVVWFRREIEISKTDLIDNSILELGPIDDSDMTWVNGKLVGQTHNSYDKKRSYKVPAGLLKTGKNVIAVRVEDYGGGGGLWGKPSEMFLQLNDKKIPLSGYWSYKEGRKGVLAMPAAVGPNSYPTLLYNGMISPIIPYKIKGAIWYQGESNAERAYQYRSLFPSLIHDWRNSWAIEDFPFLFVQLANFKAATNEPQPSDWAELREAQAMTLSLPNTGMAVIIDIGEAADIHPRNKKDVGDRLALAGRKIAYSEDIVFSGPTYSDMSVEGNKIRLSFENVGGGLVARDGELQEFLIAGQDKKFVRANAKIDKGTIVVWNDNIPNPVAVRYAWADNPAKANLYNNEGLPASPFRTDEWPGITAGKK